MLQRKKNDKEAGTKKRKKRSLNISFQNTRKSVGGVQQSDKEGPGQTENTHQSSRRFSERTREGTVKRGQERCRGKYTEQSYHAHKPRKIFSP